MVTPRASHTLHGYAALFRSPSRLCRREDGAPYRYIISHGAFTAALALPNGIVAKLDHEGPTLGSREDGTLRLEQDTIGLRFELDLCDDNPDHARLIRLVERGRVRGASFAHKGHWFDWRVHHFTGKLYSVIGGFDGLTDIAPATRAAFKATREHIRLVKVCETEGVAASL